MIASDRLNQVFNAQWQKPALIVEDRSFSYAELYAHAGAIRDWLEQQGCRSGDSVALRLPNGWVFASAYLACILGNYQAVPVNIELHQDDQEYIIRRTEARIVLCEEELLAGLQPIEANHPNFAFPADEVAAVFFTSGTTGRPKGVCHTLDALVGNARAFNQSMGLDASTRLYHCLPMAYMAGFLNTLLSPWMAGGVVLLGARFRPVDALTFWTKPLAWGANTIWLTPMIAGILVRMSRDSGLASKVGESMRQVFCGTAPLPLVMRQSFQKTFGCPLQESYGMSEVLLVSAQIRAEAEVSAGVGRLLPGLRLSFRALPEGGGSELVIHTPFSLTGYMLEDGETSPLLPDGGMPSGDTAEVRDGSLVITGRLKDIIIRGGLNVSPVAVEGVLLREPGVREVSVVASPHDFWGEIIVACLVPEEGMDTCALQNRLRLRCASELGEGMRPDRYVWLNALPRSSTGKVQKHVLVGQLA